VISILAKETDPARLTDTLPEILDFVHERLAALRNRKIPLEELVVDQTLSRELDRYGVLSPMAAAAHQLEDHGKAVDMGRGIKFRRVSLHCK
jgi:DNA polymerase elongation subunit (family B)